MLSFVLYWPHTSVFCVCEIFAFKLDNCYVSHRFDTQPKMKTENQQNTYEYPSHVWCNEKWKKNAAKWLWKNETTKKLKKFRSLLNQWMLIVSWNLSSFFSLSFMFCLYLLKDIREQSFCLFFKLVTFVISWLIEQFWRKHFLFLCICMRFF